MDVLHPVWPLAGGALIGLSAGLYLLLNGRVAGISGLTAAATGLARGSPVRPAWLFLGGLLGGAWLTAHLVRTPEVSLSGDWRLLVAGGLLVGFGTRLGGGCTSGHGVCGLARLSPRSIVATLLFMAVAALTVHLWRHELGGAA